MQVRDMVIQNVTAKGVEIPLPKAMLVLVTAPKGYLMCGYLDIATAEKMGDCAAIIRGVRSVDELLAGKVVAMTPEATKAGITAGMTGRQALEKLL